MEIEATPEAAPLGTSFRLSWMVAGALVAGASKTRYTQCEKPTTCYLAKRDVMDRVPRLSLLEFGASTVKPVGRPV